MLNQDKKSLGDSLVEAGIISAEQLKKAQEEEKNTGTRLRKVLIDKGMVSEEDLAEFISNKLSLPRIELNNYLIDPKIIELVPEELARKHELIPLLKIGNRLTCVMVDPWNIFALDEVRAKTNLIIEPAVATESEIKKSLGQYYGTKGTMEDLIKTMHEEKLGFKEEKEIDLNKLGEIADQAPVIKLVNLTIMKAVKEGASDIHIEPEEEGLNIRLRVDGMLYGVSSPPKYLQFAIISRIKIMANLDIAERRKPQDGSFSIKMEGKEIDIRVSCVPTMHGENVVLRLLDVSSVLLGLDQLGFPKSVQDTYEKLIVRSHGIILVTGPTGSGKTTTLYASLAKINTVEKNIITIEDPVEYKLRGIRQIQVNLKADLTFANGLRSILRQDPNVIMVGEIRDYETAEIAIHAALTGHLVFSTLHTNDAAGAITRLIDLGAEAFLVSSSVIGVLAQRLIRTICPHCKEKYSPTKEVLKDLGLDEEEKIEFSRGKGCSKCMQSGYKGRIGIFELMVMNDKIHSLTTSKTPREEIKRQAVASGMLTLRDDGIKKIKDGLTTVEEVLRVIQEE
ncbi:MAG: type II secretion system ATPase GspE [Candidatus Omnitrophota bacterium]